MYNGPAVNRTLLPRPTQRQLDLVDSLAPEIRARAESRPGRGLVAVRMDEARATYTFGFTPARLVDVPHIMAMDVPEEAAVEVVRAAHEHDEAESAAVIVVDRRADGRTEHAFVLLDVRPGGRR